MLDNKGFDLWADGYDKSIGYWIWYRSINKKTI